MDESTPPVATRREAHHEVAWESAARGCCHTSIDRICRLWGNRTEGSGPGFPATVEAWAIRDGCDPHATDTKPSSRIILRTYRCPAGTDVEFYIIIAGGHAWPGSKFSQEISSITGYTTFQINATDAIWAFFRRFRL